MTTILRGVAYGLLALIIVVLCSTVWMQDNTINPIPAPELRR